MIKLTCFGSIVRFSLCCDPSRAAASPCCLHSRSLHPVYRPRGFLKKWYFSLSILRCVSRSNRSRRTHTTLDVHDTRRPRAYFPKHARARTVWRTPDRAGMARKNSYDPCPKLFMSRVHSRTIIPNNNQNSYVIALSHQV